MSEFFKNSLTDNCDIFTGKLQYKIEFPLGTCPLIQDIFDKVFITLETVNVCVTVEVDAIGRDISTLLEDTPNPDLLFIPKFT